MSEQTSFEPEKIDRGFKRQTVLFQEIAKIQLECEHEIDIPKKDILTCRKCGAIWIK